MMTAAKEGSTGGELEEESGIRARPPKCWPKEEGKGGEGLWWWAGTPMATPPLGPATEGEEEVAGEGK